MPQLAFGRHTRRGSGADPVLRRVNLIGHLRQALRLRIQRGLRRCNERFQFGQTIGAHQLLGNRRAVAIGGKAVPAAQPACQRHQTFAGGKCLAIIGFSHTHHRQSRRKLCRGVDKMDQGTVGDLAKSSRTAQPAAPRFAANARIRIIPQRSGQSAFIAWLDRNTVDCFVAFALGQGTLQCALFGQ